MRLDVRFEAVPVEAMRAFLEPLGYRFDWGPELEGIGFHWQKQPLSGTGVRATYFPAGGEGLRVSGRMGGVVCRGGCVESFGAGGWWRSEGWKTAGVRRGRRMGLVVLRAVENAKRTTWRR